MTSTCPACQHALPAGDWLARHVCPACGAPQPLAKGAGGAENEGIFEAFGAPARFAQDRAALEKRFYEVSRALHPDRFTRAPAEQKLASLERMSFVNEAWRTLKDPALLREHLLERLGADGSKGPAGTTQPKAPIPAELAESWFELQDVMLEEPAEAPGRIAAFRTELAEMREALLARITAGERAVDAALDRGEALPGPRLGDMTGDLRTLGYLASLERDVARLAAKG